MSYVCATCTSTTSPVYCISINAATTVCLQCHDTAFRDEIEDLRSFNMTLLDKLSEKTNEVTAAKKQLADRDVLTQKSASRMLSLEITVSDLTQKAKDWETSCRVSEERYAASVRECEAIKTVKQAALSKLHARYNKLDKECQLKLDKVMEQKADLENTVLIALKRVDREHQLLEESRQQVELLHKAVDSLHCKNVILQSVSDWAKDNDKQVIVQSSDGTSAEMRSMQKALANAYTACGILQRKFDILKERHAALLREKMTFLERLKVAPVDGESDTT